MPPTLSLSPAARAPRPALSPLEREPFRVLFAFQTGDLDTVEGKDAIRRAYALSRIFQGDFFVLRVLRGSHDHSVVLQHLSLVQAMKDIASVQRLLGETIEWCEQLVPGIASEQILLRPGNHLQEVARAAREIKADLVVVPRQQPFSGRNVTWLTNAVGVPVLVARPAIGETIVAATDLLDPRFPVLQQAAELSQRLRAPLVCVHNIKSDPPGQPSRGRRAFDLPAVSARLKLEAESIVARCPTATEAVLGEARAREADVVVVGTRPRSWLDRLTSRDTASRVVEEALRSVLVTPILSARPPS